MKWKFVTYCTLLVTTPTLLAPPRTHCIPRGVYAQQMIQKWVPPTTYDEILQMLEDLESGELERKCTPLQLELVNQYLALLAEQGVLPNETKEEMILAQDTHDLLYGEDSIFQLAQSFEEATLTTAVFNSYSDYDILQCGKISKSWRKTKKFVKKHKKPIIIGAVVVVAVAGVAVAVVAASSAGVASAATAVAGVVGSVVPESSTSTIRETDTPIFKTAMEEELTAFKENLAQENFFGKQELSWEETGRVIGPLFAHDSFNHFQNHLSNSPQFAQEIQSISSQVNTSLPSGISPSDYGHQEIDRRFSSNCGAIFSNPDQETNFTALTYQMRGETAHSFGYYNQAVHDYSKAIEMNPTDPMFYLHRSTSYFDMGKYDQSFEDFNRFKTQVEQGPQKIPFSTPEFTVGFAKGLPEGIYESGRGILLFLSDLVVHPIHSATQMYDALSALARLAKDDEWKMIGEALSPEIYQLITEWDTLPSEKKGELSGYALGKHGADILSPGAIAKIASKSAKSAQELTAVLKNLQRAEETLILETAAAAGNTASIGEIVNAGRQAAFLGEELGFTGKEISQLQKVGKLEQAIDSACENWLAKSPSEAYIAAKNGGKHAPLISKFSEKPIKEIQKSINSYEKLIALHKDKIANPSNHCQNWDTFHPNRQKALVEKIWPAEIECYTDQRDILQIILNQKL